MKLIAGIACVIALLTAAQVAAQSTETLMRSRLLIMQRQLRGIGDLMDGRARVLQELQSHLNSDDRKLAAWREVEAFEVRIGTVLQGFAEKLQSSIEAEKSRSERIDNQFLVDAVQSDRSFEQSALNLIRLQNQQAMALALLPRTGRFWVFQLPIDETVRIAEDWRRQWSNTIDDEEALRDQIAAR